MTRSAIRTSLFVLLIAGAFACGSDDDGVEPPGRELDAEVTDPTKSCPAETPPFDFGPTGLGATNEVMGVKAYLDTASSKPPQNGSNDWTIAFTDMQGAAMPTANLTWACAWMPAHGHGSNPKIVESLGGGRYKLLKQNMAMQGGWQIRLWVDPTGGGTTYTGGNAGSINRTSCTKPGTDPDLTLYACVPR
jgi:hypothetical protein